MENLGLPVEVLNNFREFNRSVRILMDNYQLLKGHEGEYVAIGKGKILGFSDKRKALLQKYGDAEGLLIEFITPSNIPWIL